MFQIQVKASQGLRLGMNDEFPHVHIYEGLPLVRGSANIGGSGEVAGTGEVAGSREAAADVETSDTETVVDSE